MDLDLKGKVAVISGASEGIGLACAERLVDHGASVAICARTAANVAAAEKELEARAAKTGKGGHALGVVADFAKGEDIDRFVDQAAKKLGGVDIAVNCAGGSNASPFLELKDEDVLAGWGLKALGAIRLTRAVTPIMESRGGGAVVILGGGHDTPRAERVTAWTTNAALRSFVTAVSADLAKRGVTVNLVSPGLVATKRAILDMEQRAKLEGKTLEQVTKELNAQRPSGHMTTADELADLVVFLGARKVINLTGQEFQFAF